ncbi:adenylate/guanylate cyclase domain-containing protein [Allocoleopsis franciscana]|uniref:PAS domain S-box n=1 Tax=Allocoleopsis franciscana PCC 7113 TaxID=1173027 RepID=K9WJE6_9CYAN|nr:adenylate/guanylate cyclase domain-containing protein [Allocoleopsis franciscana]AFZ19632.1 PAS domain S-box [Allocoleopsis franciscana PCC 7113]
MTKQVIICVDDETTVLRSLKAELKKAVGNAYLIEIAEGAEEALELVEELLEKGDEVPLVISDYIMPDMKGDELLKRVHQLSAKTLKIMLTGQADLEAVTNAINYAKLYRYIAKPWQSEDLRLTVTEAINSYIQDKNLDLKNAKLQQLNLEQAALIAKLDASDRKFRAIFNQTFQFTGMLNTQGILLEANQTALDFGGLQLSDVVGKPVWECYWWTISPITQAQLQAAVTQAVQGQFIRYEVDVLGENNRTATLDFSIKPIWDASSKVEYLIVEGRDISDRKQAEAEREQFTNELYQLNEAFSRFVPSQFLQLLDKKSIADVRLGDQVQKEMSVLFSDIRDFTTLSESMTPQDSFNFINDYLSCMELALIENQGFIDKYIGDGIMALFSGGADDALLAGISMLQRLAEYNRNRAKFGYVSIKIGIGINTGSLMLGTVGGKNRMDGTVISDAVNLAARLESLTKEYRVPLLITHYTLARLQNPMEYSIRFIDKVKVKGKSKAVAVFEVFDGDEPQVQERKLATKTIFEEGLFLYHQQATKQAAQRFKEVLRLNPKDTVAQIYQSRCQFSTCCKSQLAF